MSQVRVSETSLETIADAIRAKLGVQTTYRPSEMAAAIQSIPTGGSAVLEHLSVTQNGTYTPGAGVDGFDQVTVNVSGGGTTILHGSSYPSAEVGEDGQIYLQTWTFIRTNGDVYFDLGYVPNANSEIDANFIAHGTRSNAYQFIFGSRNQTGSYPTFAFSVRDNSTWRGRASFGSSSTSAFSNFPLEKPVNLTLKLGQCVFESDDGTTQTISLSGSSDGTQPLCLFTLREGTTVTSHYADASLAALTIKENDSIVKNFIAWEDTGGNACLKETVSDALVYPAGSGSLTYEQNIIIDAFVKENGAWQRLIGSSIDDVTAGSEGRP